MILVTPPTSAQVGAAVGVAVAVAVGVAVGVDVGVGSGWPLDVGVAVGVVNGVEVGGNTVGVAGGAVAVTVGVAVGVGSVGTWKMWPSASVQSQLAPVSPVRVTLPSPSSCRGISRSDSSLSFLPSAVRRVDSISSIDNSPPTPS